MSTLTEDELLAQYRALPDDLKARLAGDVRELHEKQRAERPESSA